MQQIAFLAFLLFAPPPPPGVLHSVTINGAHLYSAEAIVRETGLTIGQKITPAQLEEARTKLQNTELFNNVADQFKYGAGPNAPYDATFTVTENEQLFPLRFDGLGVDPEALRNYLKQNVPLYADRIPGTQGVMGRYSAAVQEFVTQNAPKPFKVKAQISNEDPKELVVLFTSNAPAKNIARVIVTGNQAIDTGTILRAVNQMAVGVPLSDMRLKLILDGAIKPLYAAKGYAAVTFPKIETEPSTANLGVVVKVEIKDGPQFKFGPIRFRGTGIDEEEIRANINFKPGQMYNGDQVDNFRLDMTRRMRHRGLLDASITVDTEPNDTNKTVAVIYNVKPGALYTFARLDIHGLDSTTQPVVEKLWGEKPGKPFNPDYPDFFLKRLGEQNIFDNLKDVHSDYRPDEATHTVSVNLWFKGGESEKEKQRKEKEAQNPNNPPF